MNNPYLDPKNPKNELLDTLLHDYFKKRGLSNTAEVFQSEARINGQTPPEFDKQPHGLLYDLWIKSIPQIPGPSGQSQPFICYIDTGDCVTTSKSHSSTILEVRFQPGSTIFATSSADKTVKLWDAKKPGTLLSGFDEHEAQVRSLDFHPLGGTLCSSDTSNVIKVWDLNQRVRINHCIAGSLVRFQPGSGKLLAVANQNVIAILEFPSFDVKNILKGHVKDINSICWDVTGNMIASVSEDDVRVWSDGQCIFEYQSDGKRFQSIIFHPRYPDVLVVAGFQCLELLTVETREIRTKGDASDVLITGLAATTARSEFDIASASSNSVVKIWK
ncbi:putative transcription factor WD40-like family [Medicago truncatula]|uniref:Putative transcription factor WD40-like family n=1 Tax=Medicago truncatula TaxID=3880 RepID=A0A396IF97_MEDTR|nr:putative transcription factor WD40-like family [Medicago truncatula]